MKEPKPVQNKNGALIGFVPRFSIVTKKIQPISNEEPVLHEENANESIHNRLSLGLSHPKSPQTQTTNQSIIWNMDSGIVAAKSNRISTPMDMKLASNIPDQVKNPQQKVESNQSFCQWFSCLTPKQKSFFKIIIIIAIIAIVITVAVLPPVYLFVIRLSNPQSSSTNITTSICSSTTCIGKETSYRTSIITVLYPFDGNTNDLSGYATGVSVGSPGYSNSPYVGTQALGLSSASSQYVQIPYVNLAQSFTIQAWLYPSSSPILGDYGTFGQCDSNFKCLSISLRNARFALSFDSMNANNYTLISSTVTVTQDWVHLTVVYDAVLYQQQIYVNGRIDSVSNGIVTAYQGTSSGSTTTIGKVSSSAYGSTYFQGRIDHLTISGGVARSACQIYNDATLLARYPFDTTTILNDYSVNIFNGISSGTTTISDGHLGQAIYFSSNGSYFQAQCLASFEINDQPFSFSLWINPKIIGNGGSVVHISSSQNGGGPLCYDLLAFTATGALVAQWIISSTVVNGAQGPILPINTWTHVAVVYSLANGLRLFINGQLSTASQNVGTLNVYDYNNQLYVTLGNNNPYNPPIPPNCPTSSLLPISGWFMGGIDELRIYNRELDNQEICVLANL